MARSEAPVEIRAITRHGQYESRPVLQRAAIRTAQFEHQGGRCALCGEAPSTVYDLAVDHCHTSKRLRGLLCRSCNLAMAAVDRGDEWLARAVAYRDSGVWHAVEVS